MTQMHWCHLKCVCASLGRHPHPIIFEFGKCGENDNFARIANRAKHKAMRGPIKVGDTGENDNFARIANRAKHKAIRGPIKVGDTG